jgi:hypothetical protein
VLKGLIHYGQTPIFFLPYITAAMAKLLKFKSNYSATPPAPQVDIGGPNVPTSTNFTLGMKSMEIRFLLLARSKTDVKKVTFIGRTQPTKVSLASIDR